MNSDVQATIVALRKRKVRALTIGNVSLGGKASVSVQSMTNTPTEDIRATISQIKALEEAGCEIVRLAVPTVKAARAIGEIKRLSSIPVVADIHFNHKLALIAIEEGIDALRLNPGNIGQLKYVRKVAQAALKASIPIRIGVNGGSLEEDIEKKHGGPNAAALVESALRHVELLEAEGFYDIIISLKSSSVPTTLEAYRQAALVRPYPLHVGVTEAGLGVDGQCKSLLGIGLLLTEGIGETIRVSLTGDPVKEITTARHILNTVASLAPSSEKRDSR